METEPFAQLVGALGFPIVVAFYVLVRVEKGIKELTTMVHELTLALMRMHDLEVARNNDDGIHSR